jgi:hypothetical protein
LKYKIFKQIFKKELIRSLDFYLVVLSSILLGIWAVKETIALRNILLLGGAPLSIYYITQELGVVEVFRLDFLVPAKQN